jgi:putative transposase
MVQHPGDYPWSSYHYNAYGKPNKFISTHALYNSLGITEEECRQNYRTLFSTVLSKGDIHAIRRASQFSMPLGNERFKEQIEKHLGQSIGYDKRGRPNRWQRKLEAKCE